MTISTSSSCNEMALATAIPAQDRNRMRRNWQRWQMRASTHGADHEASWGDRWAIELEIANLLRHLSPGGRWLDAGCANGYTTFRTLVRNPESILAIDFSGEMIGHAADAQALNDPKAVITFRHGNILDIPAGSNSLDAAYTVRALINLPSREAQAKAIREIHRVVKSGGRFIVSEAFAGSLQRLNALRALADLPPLPMPEFNLYLHEDWLEQTAAGLFDIDCIERFSSPYYVATRFLRELVSETSEPSGFDSPINEMAAGWPVTSRSGDFGIQKAYILKKR